MADTATEAQEQTFGQRMVGSTFNPSKDDRVSKLKALYAEIIDILHEERQTDGSDKDPEVNRLASIAITEAQGAQMWAVKAVTFGKNDNAIERK